MKQQLSTFLKMDRLNSNIDMILSGTNATIATCESLQVAETGGELNSETNADGITELSDPTKVKQKGRSCLPKRLKPLVEEIKEKLKKKEAKKNNKPKANAGNILAPNIFLNKINKVEVHVK